MGIKLGTFGEVRRFGFLQGTQEESAFPVLGNHKVISAWLPGAAGMPGRKSHGSEETKFRYSP